MFNVKVYTVIILLMFSTNTFADITPNDFKGSDSERINQAVVLGAKSGARVVIPHINENNGKPRDFWLLDSAILVHSNTLLELQNCRLKLSDISRDNFIRSANCGMGIADIKPMNNIHIIGTGRPILEGPTTLARRAIVPKC